MSWIAPRLLSGARSISLPMDQLLRLRHFRSADTDMAGRGSCSQNGWPARTEGRLFIIPSGLKQSFPQRLAPTAADRSDFGRLNTLR